MKIRVVSTDIELKRIQGKRGPVELRLQAAFLETDDGQRIKFSVSLSPDQATYPAGEYALSDSSFSVSRFGDLEVDRFNIGLVPVKLATPVAAVR